MVKDDTKFNFEKDERVLCYHGPFIYEAKVGNEAFCERVFIDEMGLDFEKGKEGGRRRGSRK